MSNKAKAAGENAVMVLSSSNNSNRGGGGGQQQQQQKATTLQQIKKQEVNNQKSVAAIVCGTSNKKCASATTPQSSAPAASASCSSAALNVDNSGGGSSSSIRPPPPSGGSVVATKLELLLLQKPNGGAAAKKRSLAPIAGLTAAAGATEDIRKKRCSDRYDSSESSDSGVAVLSCTDSSTTSSDSSDPGSPYSPGSVDEAANNNNTNLTQPGSGVAAPRPNMPSVTVGLPPPSLLLTTSAQRPLHAKPANGGSDQHIIQSSTVSSSCKTDVPALVRGGGATAAATPNAKLLMHPWTNWGTGEQQVILPKLVATTPAANSGAPAVKGFSSGAKAQTPGGASNNKLSLAQGKKTANAISPMVSNGGIGGGALTTAIYPVSSSTPVAAITPLGASSAASAAAKPQSKITGFFKTQMKVPPTALLANHATAGGLAGLTSIGSAATSPPPLVKKDLTNLVIRSKEFPKINQAGGAKKAANRKPAGERKPRGGKNAAAGLAGQGNSIRDIMMKKPVNIAPRVDATLVPIKPQQQQQLPKTSNSVDMKPEVNTSGPRLAQQPQLVLTAYRLNPEMIANGHHSLAHNNNHHHPQNPMRIPPQTNGMSTPQIVPTGPTTGRSMAATGGVQGGSPADNKINTVFQYPLNGSFVSFANLMPQQTMSASPVSQQQQQQHHQPTGTNNGLPNGQTTGIDGKAPQQQIFLGQLGPIGKSTANTQFILNGHTLVNAGQTTRLMAMAAAGPPPHGDNGGGENSHHKASSPPALISTVNLAAANKQNHPPAPMFMAMGQGGQFILNTGGPLPPLLATTTTTQVGGGGVPPTMPSLQPISLSSLAESHHSHSSASALAQNNTLLKRDLPKGRMPLSSSPPELVFLQPIAKALAGRRITNPVKNDASLTKLKYPGLTITGIPDKGEKMGPQPPISTTTITTKSVTEIVQQTLMTTTTITTKTVSEAVGEQKSLTTTKERSLAAFNHCEEQRQAINTAETVIAVVPAVATISIPPPNLTSPKSLVLEKLKLKSESTIKATTTIHGNLRQLEISTDCLDLAKKQLGVLVDQQECAKSPILSQPKTIRFPVRGSEMNGKALRKSGGYVSGNCYWEECNARFENSSKLLDHLQTHHVNGQSGPFSCHWLGCRVNGRESCSRRWLEGHVLSHGGSKTFKCIFEGCGQRFSSQLALQKHVNIHLSSSEKEAQVTNRRSLDGGNGAKYLKRNGKKLRYRRQPWSARMFDFFDSGIMEGLQHRLGVSSQIATDGMLHLRARELARRTLNGGTEVYVEWSPANIVQDEWICLTPGKVSNYIVSLAPLVKSIPIRQLSSAEQSALNKHLRRSYTKPLAVENFLPFNTFAMAAVQPKSEEKEIKLENPVQSAMDDDLNSDSGKGTQRSGSSASVQTTVSSASPVSSCKSDVRKMKRKSKSSSSESQSSMMTEDSGLPKTARKHLAIVIEKCDVIVKKAQQPKIKEGAPKKKSQYLKEKKSNLNMPASKGKRTVVAGGEKLKAGKREKC